MKEIYNLYIYIMQYLNNLGKKEKVKKIKRMKKHIYNVIMTVKQVERRKSSSTPIKWLPGLHFP